jgi:hypothetical protein
MNLFENKKIKIDPFNSIKTTEYVELMKDYIDYINKNMEKTKIFMDREHMCKRYIEHYEYTEYVNNQIIQNKPYIIKIFTHNEIFYNDHIIKYIYECQSSKLHLKLYTFLLDLVLNKVKYVNEHLNELKIDYMNESLSYESITELQEKYEEYKMYEKNGCIIDLEILYNDNNTVDMLIQKYKQCIRFDYIYSYLFYYDRKDKDSMTDFYHSYSKYKDVIWTDKKHIKYPEFSDIIIDRNNPPYLTMYL